MYNVFRWKEVEFETPNYSFLCIVSNGEEVSVGSYYKGVWRSGIENITHWIRAPEAPSI